MSGHSTYEPKTGIERWLDARLPIVRFALRQLRRLPDAAEPELLVDLRRHPGPLPGHPDRHRHRPGDALRAARRPWPSTRVERIMRDVNYGWLIRYIHANGASMFFIAVYIHMFRGLYYGSYKAPREVLWILGCVIYLLMMATGLPGLRAALGPDVLLGRGGDHQPVSAPSRSSASRSLTWLWGGFAVDNPTLNRFFSLHYLLPFVIAGVVVLHIWALHVAGQNNPTGIDPKSEGRHRARSHPYYTVKDGFAIVVFLILFALFVFYMPNALGHADNYIPANPLVTPAHIVPEWYFLPFYAILRADPGQARSACWPCSARSPSCSSCRGWTPRKVARCAIVRCASSSSGCSSRSASSSAGSAPSPRKASTSIAVAHPDHLLLRALHRHLAAARHIREDQAVAEFDLGIGFGLEGVRRDERSMKTQVDHHRSRARRAASLVTCRRAAIAAEGAPVPPAQKWSFAGPFGKFDQGQLQRGFKVYKEVCASCHSMSLVSFRNLAEAGGPGFSEAQAAAVAAEYKIKDIDDKGEAIERAGRPADAFPAPFANDRAAAAANGGVAPPDFSTAGQGPHL